ncbi:MAG: NADPH2:quinone reductase [Paracoccaceae bacterium]|jgi:NADPH2:quinone reductase
MQAYQVLHIGKPAEMVTLPAPDPGPGQVRLDMRACGLNFADLLLQKGTYQETPEVPFTLGMEGSGVVTALGESVDGLKIGDRVAVFCGQGGLAEQGVFDVARTLPLPEGISFEQGAAFQIAYGTAHMALDHCARLQPGETLLVTGAAGGTGLAAVEIGKLMGARVIAHARGADKLTVAGAAGADFLIDDSDDLRARVLELGGADVVYDTIGGEVFRAAFRATNPGGRLLPIGFASGEVPQIPANHLLVKNLTVIGFYIGGYMKFHPKVVANSLKTLLSWQISDRLTAHIGHTLPLDQVAKGMDLLRQRKATGKVVITI